MPLSKLLGLLSLSFLMLYLFTGNHSLYSHILGNTFFTALRRLLLGAYLVFPIASRMQSTWGIYQIIHAIVLSFIFSVGMYLGIEVPIGDFARKIISDLVNKC
jgi:hypothetical protein